MDEKPILATDPWIRGAPYFGSWTWESKIPVEQFQQIQRAKYIWFSHGHPDHLNADSLHYLSDKEILLSDHVGARIHHDLSSLGFQVEVLPERRWVPLSKNIRIMTACDYFQDSILLLDIGGRLVMNLNDAIERGWGSLVRRHARQFKHTYLLKLSGYGDGDMINLFDEQGRKIIPYAAKKNSVGEYLSRAAHHYHARYVIAFSSFHRKQREDSIWADEYATPISAFGEGFRSQESEFLGAYVRVDCESGEVTPLNPEKNERVIRPPSDFGDSWSDVLDETDKKKLAAYVQAKEKLACYFGFIGFRVGGEEILITLNRDIPKRGLLFEAPRNSLICAVDNRVFDDLLIGNFMKTTLIGCDSLHPHFTPYVGKYSDNAGADTKSDLRRYFWRYFIRAPLPMLSHIMEEQSVNFLRNHLSDSQLAFKAAKSVYRMFKPVV